MITNPDALAIWVYLMSQSEAWIPRPNDIKKRWGLGRYRYMEAMRHLKSLGLAWDHEERDEQGRITSKCLNVGSIPLDLADKLQGLSTSQVSDTMDYPTCGQADHIIKDQLVIKNQSNVQDDLNDFNRFYGPYPKHQGKQDALKAWRSLNTTERELAVKDTATREWPENKQYIPLPATYLRGKRWEDERDEVQEVSYI